MCPYKIRSKNWTIRKASPIIDIQRRLHKSRNFRKSSRRIFFAFKPCSSKLVVIVCLQYVDPWLSPQQSVNKRTIIICKKICRVYGSIQLKYYDVSLVSRVSIFKKKINIYLCQMIVESSKMCTPRVRLVHSKMTTQ